MTRYRGSYGFLHRHGLRPPQTWANGHESEHAKNDQSICAASPRCPHTTTWTVLSSTRMVLTPNV